MNLPDNITREVAYVACCHMGAALERALIASGVPEALANKVCQEVMVAAFDAASAPGEVESFMARVDAGGVERRRGMN